MSKLILTLCAIVALTAIFVIPSAYSPTLTQVAKASSCSSSSSAGGGLSSSQSFNFQSGSCSFSSSATSGFAAGTAASGGKQSSCSSGAATQRDNTGFLPANTHTSNGAVSCNVQAP